MEPRVQLAADALDRGNGQRALEHLAEVGELPDPEVWRLRGSALESLGHHAAAEDACRRGLTVDPGHIGLQLQLAECLKSQQRESDAEHVLIAVLNQHPENLAALNSYAWLLAGAGDAIGARQVMARIPEPVMSLMPNMLALQGYVALIEGRQAEARAFLDRGLGMDPEATSLRMLTALARSLDDRPTEAVQHMRAAAALDPVVAGDMGREARYLGHPLMAPSRWIARIGPASLWVSWIVILFGLPRIWPGAPMTPIIVVYLAFAAYSWVAPPALRWWLRRRGQL